MLALLFKVERFFFNKFINHKLSLDWIKNEAMFDVKQAGYQTLTIPQDGNYRSGLTVNPAGTFSGNNPGTGMRTFWPKMFFVCEWKFSRFGNLHLRKVLCGLIKLQYTYKAP